MNRVDKSEVFSEIEDFKETQKYSQVIHPEILAENLDATIKIVEPARNSDLIDDLPDPAEMNDPKNKFLREVTMKRSPPPMRSSSVKTPGNNEDQKPESLRSYSKKNTMIFTQLLPRKEPQKKMTGNIEFAVDHDLVGEDDGASADLKEIMSHKERISSRMMTKSSRTMSKIISGMQVTGLP